MPEPRVRLAGRGSMDSVEAPQPLRIKRQDVGADRRERIPLQRLAVVVHTDDVEAGSVIAHRGAALTAEQIQQPHSDRTSISLTSADLDTPRRLASRSSSTMTAKGSDSVTGLVPPLRGWYSTPVSTLRTREGRHARPRHRPACQRRPAATTPAGCRCSRASSSGADRSVCRR